MAHSYTWNPWWKIIFLHNLSLEIIWKNKKFCSLKRLTFVFYVINGQFIKQWNPPILVESGQRTRTCSLPSYWQAIEINCQKRSIIQSIHYSYCAILVKSWFGCDLVPWYSGKVSSCFVPGYSRHFVSTKRRDTNTQNCHQDGKTLWLFWLHPGKLYYKK